MWVLREKFLIVQRRDGCVFKTKSEGLVWVDSDTKEARCEEIGDYVFAPVSTSYSGPTRSLKKEKPNL